MNKSRWIGLALAAAALLTCGAWAQEKASPSVQFKTGDIAFTILKSDGVTPVEEAKIMIRRSARSKALAEAVADKQGNAVITLAKGKYVLNVEGRNISELNVADDAELLVCRVVLDDDKAAAALAAGAGTAAVAAGVGTGAAVGAAAVGAGTFTTIVVGGVAVMAAAGGGYAIYDNNKDDDKDDTPVPPVPPTPDSRRRPSTR